MAQFDTANTFSNGDLVDGPSLNNIIDQAFALDGLITLQDSLTGAINPAADQVLVWDSSATPSPTKLRRALVQALPSGVTSVGLTATPASVFGPPGGPITTAGTLSISLDSQDPGKVLAGPISGSPTTPAFRVLAPSDLPVATIPISAALIDWSLGNCFSKSVTGTVNFTFSNASAGQAIRILIAQTGGFAVNFPTGVSGVYWPSGTAYTATTGAGQHDIVTLQFIGGHYWGTFDKGFLSV